MFDQEITNAIGHLAAALHPDATWEEMAEAIETAYSKLYDLHIKVIEFECGEAAETTGSQSTTEGSCRAADPEC